MSLITLNKKQVAELVNDATKELVGETSVLQEDLSNVVDLGIAIENANAYKNFLENLLVRIGKSEYIARPYTATTPKVYRDAFEYGQITQRVTSDIDEAVDNQSWEIVDGGSYDDNQFVANSVRTKLFMKDTTYEIRKSITNKQIKNAFTSAEELGSFVSMILTNVQNSLEVKNESLTLMTIANAMGELINGGKAINLFGLFKTAFPSTSLTYTNCMYDKTFLQFCADVMMEYSDNLTKMTSLYNLGGKKTFTPKEKQHFVLLSEFARKFDTFLESDTFHNELVKLPLYEKVTCWQGMGTAGAFADKSKINIKTSAGNEVVASGIVGCIFDDLALGITNYGEEVETHYVKSAQFTNYWFKREASYFNDLDMNFVVFYIGAVV